MSISAGRLLGIYDTRLLLGILARGIDLYSIFVAMRHWLEAGWRYPLWAVSPRSQRWGFHVGHLVSELKVILISGHVLLEVT